MVKFAPVTVVLSFSNFPAGELFWLPDGFKSLNADKVDKKLNDRGENKEDAGVESAVVQILKRQSRIHSSLSHSRICILGWR